jgi:hypothetical protein
MIEKEDLSRNDLAAFAVFKKMLSRMTEQEEAHAFRAAALLAQASAFGQLNGLQSGGYTNTARPINLNGNISAQQLQAIQLAQAQVHVNSLNSLYSAMGAHSHSISGSSLGAHLTSWTPYMTQSEWETFKAYENGENVLLHVLAEERP